MKAKVGLKYKFYPGTASISTGQLTAQPQLLEWDLGDGPQKLTIFTERNLDDALISTSPVKLAWLVEPPGYHGDFYQQIRKPEVYNRFDFVMTYVDSLLHLDPKFMFIPFGGCWIQQKDWKIWPKTKNVSIIASFKRDMEGHKLRHAVVDKYRDQIEGLYGNAYQALDDKLDGLKDFRYSIVIENEKSPYFFTEKLIDCFATGTVPIYWGANVENFFNPDGVISFSSIKELDSIMATLSEDDYQKRLEAIKDNFERFKKYVFIEDYMYQYILKPRYDWL